jgi:hypothetical protein
MALLGNSTRTYGRFASSWRTTMGKKKRTKMTPAEYARQEETLRLARERIAERRAFEREWDERAAADKK